MKHLDKILKLYVPPFSYQYGYIYDGNGNVFADDPAENLTNLVRVRGWGYLTGKGAQGIDHDTAAEIQDEIGEMIAEALTEYWEKKKQERS